MLRLIAERIDLVEASNPDDGLALLAARPVQTACVQAIAMSPQQWKILELLAQGLPSKEIARKLGIASGTVKNQLTAIFERLGVSNRTQAAVAARALVENAGAAQRGR